MRREMEGIAVVKIGGSIEGGWRGVLEDIVEAWRSGRNIVLVHGGGKEISLWQDKLQIPVRFERGRRVTSPEVLEVVTAVLAGIVNKKVVAEINKMGGKAIGLSGIDGPLFKAKMSSPDLGLVGEVEEVNTKLVLLLLEHQFIPVIAPLGINPSEGKILNINGDLAASALARSLKAELFFLTDVPGVLDGEGRVIPALRAEEAREMIARGIISGGMIPKVEASLSALPAAPSARILRGASGALLSALRGGEEGTLLLP